MSEATLPAVLDGEVVLDGFIPVQVLGGGFQHGEGLFETLPVVGGVPYFFKRHCRRIAVDQPDIV